MNLFLVSLITGIIVIVSVLVGVEHPALVDLIQQNVKQSWVLGVLGAVIVCCVAAQRFWKFRRYLRVWAVTAAYVFVHFAVAVPAFGKLGRVEYGHREELYLDLFLIAEAAVLIFVLNRVTAPLARAGR